MHKTCITRNHSHDIKPAHIPSLQRTCVSFPGCCTMPCLSSGVLTNACGVHRLSLRVTAPAAILHAITHDFGHATLTPRQNMQQQVFLTWQAAASRAQQLPARTTMPPTCLARATAATVPPNHHKSQNPFRSLLTCAGHPVAPPGCLRCTMYTHCHKAAELLPCWQVC